MKFQKEITDHVQANPETQENIHEDALTHVLGPERHGRVRGVGFGVTPTKLNAHIQYSGKVKELEQKFQNQTSLVHAQNQRMETLEKKMEEMSALVYKQSQQVKSVFYLQSSCVNVEYIY